MSMAQQHRPQLWRGRLTRRGLLRGASMGAAGLAALACSNKTPSGTATGPANPAQQAAPETAKPGGTVHAPLEGTSSQNPNSLDPYNVAAGFIVNWTSNFHYSRLLRVQAGPGDDPIDYTKITGDVAEKWEQVDPTTYVFHLRPNIKFHNVPPINGRPLTAEDIRFSHQLLAERSIGKLAWTNVVAKVETPDDQSVRITLKSPFAPFATLVANPQRLYIVPKEYDTAKLQERPIGTGPFVFDKLEKDVAVTWHKHPDYFIPGRPLVDRWEASVVNDASTIIANLKSGAYDFSTALTSSLYGTVKGEAPNLATQAWPSVTVNTIYFNYDIKPWNDLRVRQALSMAMDRDGILKALDPTGKAAYQTAIGQLVPWWLDPKSSSFGPNAKYFKRDLTEAKKLLAAAGFPNGIDAKLTYSPFYGKASEQGFVLVATTAKDAGFRFSMVGQDYAAYRQTTFYGQFSEGAAIGPLYSSTDPDDLLFSIYHPDSSRKNWSGSGPDTLAADTKLLDMFDRQQKELDFQKRQALIQDIQRYMAEKMYLIPIPASATFSARNAWVKGYYDKQSFGWGTEVGMNIGLDKRS